jgi:hypothetical protein
MIWFTSEKGWSGRGLVVESILPSLPNLPGGARQMHIDEERGFAALSADHVSFHSLASERFMERLNACPTIRPVCFTDNSHILQDLPDAGLHGI